MKSNWNNDSRAESQLGMFMDNYLYSRVAGKCNITSYERVSDKTLQKSGVDIILHTNKKDFYIDEKACLQYINRDIPTFAFELCYSGKVGWFLKDDLITDIYCLIWPHACVTDLSKINSEDFNKLDVMLVPKKNLKEYINSYISDHELLKAAFQATDGTLDWTSDEKGRLYMPSNNRLYLMSTKHLYEKPVNLIVRKDILREVCSREMVVTKEDTLYKDKYNA